MEDADLEKAVMATGQLTMDQINECKGLVAKMREIGLEKDLADALVEKGYLSADQAKKCRTLASVDVVSCLHCGGKFGLPKNYVMDSYDCPKCHQTNLRDGEAAAGFLLNPTRIDQVIEIAGLGMRMPQKSTYFYPKIITGMVMRDMNPPG